MKTNSFIIVLFALSILLGSCSDRIIDPIPAPQRELTVMEKQLVNSSSDFSFKLFKKISDSEPDSNLFVSPLSISMALGMALNGADGTTYDGMKSTLDLGSFTRDEANQTYQSLIALLSGIDPKVTLNIANSIWYDNNYLFQPDFIETNKKYFNAEVSAMNFRDPAAAVSINNWVKSATNDKIDKIVDRIPEQTIMYLINAVYFKGTWKYSFDPENTKDDFFTTGTGKRVAVKMMAQETDISAFSNELFTAVDLPYGNSAFSMTLFLPNIGRNLQEVVAYLSGNSLESITGQFFSSKKKLYLPRFKLEYKINLNDVLKGLGMEEAFDPVKANFKKLYDGLNKVYISSVDHKTYVDVNEEGTEAAAVTSISVGVTSVGGNSIRVDQPFLFMIREKNSSAILFIGSLNDPS